ncbi:MULTISPECIES: sulfur carrier protein ThiS [Clostridium]|uniref:Sulfur carrier protein ThiS n=1 Tax=Clostridium cibarium TaxID=2762247 RepID=A0ABR8PTE2_9CLOT|nr:MULTISPECIES: sulfur carrier protein ThiS [Clostridium]MBD7911379.1 sulfur carrier protein ThiS [Clostridium cibarium]
MKVNGKEFELKEEKTLDKFLDELTINKEKVIVELDGAIITKEDFVNIVLKDSNVMEVISFVGGG